MRAANTPGQQVMTGAEWGRLLLLGLVWGASFFFARIAVAEFHPLVLVLLRVLIAACALHLYLLVRGPSVALALPHAATFVLLALVNNVIPFSLIAWGQSHLESGLAAILNATTPLFGVVVANFFTADERMSPARFAGAVIDNIRISNSTFRGVTETEVLTHTGSISFRNVTIEPAKTVRGLNSVPAPTAPSPAATPSK